MPSTPAPWTVKTEEGIHNIMAPNGSDIVCILPVYGRGQGHYGLQKEALENASLISAAPEMLEALQRLHDPAAQGHGFCYECNICKIIIKAEGR